MNERTTLKIERKTSPNGRYEFTLSFLMNGEWHPANYAHSAWVLQDWALAEIEWGTFTGPIIEVEDSTNQQEERRSRDGLA